MEVIVTGEFVDWYDSISEADQDGVIKSVAKLEIKGVTLGFPSSSAIEGASFALRELRVQSHGKPIRIFYAFDPARDAVLLLGGDKTGDSRFYDTMIPRVTLIWQDYLDDNFNDDASS